MRQIISDSVSVFPECLTVNEPELQAVTILESVDPSLLKLQIHLLVISQVLIRLFHHLLGIHVHQLAGCQHSTGFLVSHSLVQLCREAQGRSCAIALVGKSVALA